MTLPHALEARLFYQSAFQRFEDARFLLNEERTTGSVYLAGYSVECILKALILSLLSPARRKTMLNSFRGSKAHDVDWLKQQYHKNGGPAVPAAITQQLARVATWTTDLRYQPGAVRKNEATAFLDACKAIFDWADARL